MTKPMAFVAGALLSAMALGAGLWAYRRMNARAHPATCGLAADLLVPGNVDLNEVAFMFDDGPRPEVVRTSKPNLGRP